MNGLSHPLVCDPFGRDGRLRDGDVMINCGDSARPTTEVSGVLFEAGVVGIAIDRGAALVSG